MFQGCTGNGRGDTIEGWQPPYSGDFYASPRAACRSVRISEPPAGPDLTTSKGFIDGDYYHEPDSLFKSIAGVGATLEAAGGHGPAAPPGVERFTETDLPPDVPSDIFFRFPVTTIHVSTQMPSAIANHVLDMLGTGPIASSITKVRRSKFAIKADIFFGTHAMCTVKMRVYREARDRCALEFQRRSGDCVTFNNYYHQAARYFKLHFAGEVHVPCLAGERPAPPPLEEPTAGAELSLLLDMLGLAERPSLQADSVAALADAAAWNKELAASLCTPATFGKFREALHTDRVDVMYPTARMLSSLAECPESAPLFSDSTFKETMLSKVKSQATSAIVQQELSQVLDKHCQ